MAGKLGKGRSGEGLGVSGEEREEGEGMYGGGRQSPDWCSVDGEGDGVGGGVNILAEDWVTRCEGRGRAGAREYKYPSGGGIRTAAGRPGGRSNDLWRPSRDIVGVGGEVWGGGGELTGRSSGDSGSPRDLSGGSCEMRCIEPRR